jgi:hypothetical protein
VYAAPCNAEPPAVRDNAFKVVRGQHLLVDGKFNFTETDEDVEPHNVFYQTVFGPAVCHNGIVYDNSAASLNRAGSRLNVVRETQWYDDYLRQKQTKHIDAMSHQGDKHPLMAYLIERFAHALRDWTTALDFALEHVFDPHQKRDLRVMALHEVLEEGRSAGIIWTEAHRIAYKIKKAETAKPNKPPRCIGDLGVPASLQGAFITKLLKNALEDKPFKSASLTSTFCATPTPEKLANVFKTMSNPSTLYTFDYFSDDSCLTWCHEGMLMWANIDIAKCDASHVTALFELLYICTPPHARDCMRSLILQCSGTITIKHPGKKGTHAYRKETLVLQPVETDGKTPRSTLLSGSTLTTLINNVANLLIAYSISESKATTKKGIELAARQTGYCVTVETCQFFEQVQFLKHSPARDIDGIYRPLLNLGVLLRLSGRCKRDLPPARGKSLEERALLFQRGLIRGAMPRVNHPMATAMRTAVGLPPTTTHTNTLPDPHVTAHLGYMYQHEQDSDLYTFGLSIFDRYRDFATPANGITDGEIMELIDILQSASTGDMFSCKAADRILAMDYGLRCPNGRRST